jgi:acyl-CoA synthetase (AMP-forming)/AMP-acid ligase II
VISSIRRVVFATGRGTTLGNLFDRLADLHGDRRAAEQSDGSSYTYNSARETVARWSARVFDEVPQGGRVVVAMPNGYEQLLACVAVARGGGIPVPVNDRMSPDEIDHVIADSDADLVIWSSHEFAGYGELHEPVHTDPSAVGAIFYTSGTTGRPKGARLTHRALLGSLAIGALWPSRLRHDEAIVGLPVAHIMGFVVLIGLGVAGIPVYELPRFDERAVLDAIEQRRATIFVGVPAMYRMMLDAGAADRDLRSIRIWASGADAMPHDLARQFQRMGATATLPLVHTSVGEAAFLEGWGMVETGGAAVTRLALPFVGGPAWPMPGYHLRVDDPDGDGVGELLVRGPGVLESYHGDAGATAAVLDDDGWLRTGDLARRGRLGTVAFEGRTKDVVKSGGYSVFAAEVERVLLEHPAVAEAAVFGVPDERLGEVPAAAVRLAPGARATEDELVNFARQHLATFKTPRRVIVVPELPRGGTGKVQKDRLRDLVS